MTTNPGFPCLAAFKQTHAELMEAKISNTAIKQTGNATHKYHNVDLLLIPGGWSNMWRMFGSSWCFIAARFGCWQGQIFSVISLSVSLFPLE